MTETDEQSGKWKVEIPGTFIRYFATKKEAEKYLIFYFSFCISKNTPEKEVQ